MVFDSTSFLGTYHADGFQCKQCCTHKQSIFSRFAYQRPGRYGWQVGEYIPENDGESSKRDDVGQLREWRQQF